MNKALRIYPLMALLGATHFSPWPQSVIALALLLMALPFFFRKHLRWEIPIGLAYFFALPLLFQPVLHWLAALVALPILPVISSSLRENAQTRSIAPTTKERELTLTAKSVLAAAGSVVVVSLLLGHWTLAIAGGTALLFVAAMLARVGRGLPVPPLEAQQEELRLIAGNTGKPTIRLISRARFPLHVTVSSSHSWIRLARESFVNLTGEAELELTVTPSLSGPVEPGLEVSCTDPWGLLQVRQTVKPIKLYVIPRARYAEWLARKYIEETASEARLLAATFSPVAAGTAPRGGVEYCDSRLYQPGDRLKDMDWKHTAKLRKFVVKEYSEEARQMAIIAVNLAASDAEEADKLVYHLISSALTLATGLIPTAIAAYDQEQVLAATALLDPRELVKKALTLGQKVVLVTPLERYLQPPDIRQVRISLRQLKETDAEPARRLRKILDLESRAIAEGAREHPARKALNRIKSRSPAPAMITVISGWSHDSEALSLTLGDLEKQGYGATIVKLKEQR